MTAWILAVLAVWVVYTFLPTMMFGLTSEADQVKQFQYEHLRGRDNLPEYPKPAARAKRAVHNFNEAMPVFLGLALLHHINGDIPYLAHVGAGVFLVGRICYAPAYIAAVPMVRSVVWSVAGIGLLLMAYPLLMGLF
ncbi:MAG: MAPEG family protein [Myxococcota bacterium]